MSCLRREGPPSQWKSSYTRAKPLQFHWSRASLVLTSHGLLIGSFRRHSRLDLAALVYKPEATRSLDVM